MSTTSSPENNNRTFVIDGLVNARDLGGLRRSNGRLTPYGVFYRSENIDLITEPGWHKLKDSGIRTIIDLRQSSERATDTQVRPNWLKVIHSDLDGIDNQVFWKPYLEKELESTSMYYTDHLKQMPERAEEVLDAIATAPEGGVLFHCKSGRDRTGLIALLLLSAIDTEPEEIVDDYLETVRLGEARGKRLGRENPEPGLDKLLQEHGTTTEDAFRKAVSELEFSNFLRSTHLSDFSIRSLRTWRGSIQDV